MPASKKPSDEDLEFIKGRLKLVWVEGNPQIVDSVGGGRRWGAGRRVGGVAIGTHTSYRKLRLKTPQTARLDVLEHVLIWYLIHGQWPTLAVDHKDGNGLNNHPDNLRLATDSQNLANRSKTKANTSGFKGVYATHSKKSPWGARWGQTINGKRMNYTKACATKEEAYAAHLNGMQELFGEFARN